MHKKLDSKHCQQITVIFYINASRRHLPQGRFISKVGAIRERVFNCDLFLVSMSMSAYEGVDESV